MLNPESRSVPPRLVDTHAHLQQHPFDVDRDDVIRRATEAGVETIVAIGIDADTSEAVVELAAQYAGRLCDRGHSAQRLCRRKGRRLGANSGPRIEAASRGNWRDRIRSILEGRPL